MKARCVWRKCEIMLNPEQEKQLAELQALKGAMSGGGTTRFGTPSAAGGPLPKEIGMLIPIEISTERGKVTVQLLYDATAAENPREFVERLIREGYPVKAWQANTNGGGGSGRGFGGGGYQRNRF